MTLGLQVNIRHLKAGLRLVPSIASLGRKCASSLVKHGVMEKLCDLVMAENVASTLKLLSLRAVDSLLDYPQGMERFLGWNRKVGFCNSELINFNVTNSSLCCMGPGPPVLFIYLFICLFVCLFIYLFIYLHTYLFIYLFIFVGGRITVSGQTSIVYSGTSILDTLRQIKVFY